MLTAGPECPDSIAVIGGGRWARVLTDVLCSLVAPSVAVSVHSPHNADAMSTWATEQGLADRVRVSSEWLPTFKAATGAVIVANAARDHERTVERAIVAGIPVLVEKPMALTSDGAERMASLARDQKVRLAPAHVFLFARYLDRFSQTVIAAGPPRWVRVQWTDPAEEARYGEPKSHDPRLPIAADVLPHILSLVGALAPNGPDRCDTVAVSRDGAELGLDLVLGTLPCRVRLARKSDKRRRVIEAGVGDETIRLDFSTEPGMISRGAVSASGDPAWAEGPRPIARMLTAFLCWAAGGERDRRLDIDLGLRACRLIDQTLAWSEGGE